MVNSSKYMIDEHSQLIINIHNLHDYIYSNNSNNDDKVKYFIRKYVLEHLDKSDPIPQFDVFVVWQCYILGNAKWLLSTTLPDGMYYEVTYNKAKDEFYLDAYKKFKNICITNN